MTALTQLNAFVLRCAIAGTNRDDGRPLCPLQRTLAARYVSIDTLFETIATASRPPLHWRVRLVYAMPPLAPWIRCVRETAPRRALRSQAWLPYRAGVVCQSVHDKTLVSIRFAHHDRTASAASGIGGDRAVRRILSAGFQRNDRVKRHAGFEDARQ
jgi:hypothetical protein